MQMWFSQYHTANVKLDVRIQEQLFSGQSDYQKIDVFKSYEFGKMVALDGEIVFSDTDEFIYDEMVTHVPMAVHPNAKRWDALGLKTWYYTTHLHRGAFMLPKYVEDLLEEEETK